MLRFKSLSLAMSSTNPFTINENIVSYDGYSGKFTYNLAFNNTDLQKEGELAIETILNQGIISNKINSFITGKDYINAKFSTNIRSLIVETMNYYKDNIKTISENIQLLNIKEILFLGFIAGEMKIETFKTTISALDIKNIQIITTIDSIQKVINALLDYQVFSNRLIEARFINKSKDNILEEKMIDYQNVSSN